MKVVTNLLLYLHAKCHIFMRSLSIFPHLILPYWIIQLEKNKFKKCSRSVFLRVGLLLHHPNPSPCVSLACPRYHSTDADGRDPPVEPLFPPNPPPLLPPVCAPATLSHCIGFGVLWRRITAARLCLLSPSLRWSNSGTDRSAMKLSLNTPCWPSCRCRKRAVEATV
jgi:hypothetical protein